MKKIIIILLLIIPLLNGCYDFFELKGVSFCFGLSFDYDETKEKKYNVNIETEVIKNHLSEAEFESIIHEVKGDTFPEIYSNLTSSTSSRIDFTHCQLIIINSNIEYNDLKNLTNSLFTNVLISNGIAIMMAKDNTAKEILKSKSITNASLSFEIIYALKEDGHYYDGTFKKTISEVYNDFNSEIGNFLLPLVYLKENGDEEDKVAVIKGLMLFSDHKYIKELSDEEIKYTLFVEWKINKFIFNLKIDDQIVSLCVDPFKLKRTIVNGSRIKFLFEYKLPVLSTEIKDTKDETVASLENALEQEITKTFLLNQEKNCDIYNLKTYLYKHNYKIYKNRKDITIKDFDFEVDIKINIKDTGIIR